MPSTSIHHPKEHLRELLTVVPRTTERATLAIPRLLDEIFIKPMARLKKATNHLVVSIQYEVDIKKANDAHSLFFTFFILVTFQRHLNKMLLQRRFQHLMFEV